jgi:proteasome lid subunit RPN8/RPN11
MIELTDWLRRELARRADQEAPQEACGLISRAKPARGLPEGGIALWAAENASSDPEHHFAIDPDTLLGITRQIEARGETLVGVYHSHPGGVAAPSPEDVETAAQWPGLTWIIVARQPCPNCGGSGYVDGVEPECCGNTTGSGECRGDCAVPRQVEEACPCGGEPVPTFWNGVLA